MRDWTDDIEDTPSELDAFLAAVAPDVPGYRKVGEVPGLAAYVRAPRPRPWWQRALLWVVHPDVVLVVVTGAVLFAAILWAAGS